MVTLMAGACFALSGAILYVGIPRGGLQQRLNQLEGITTEQHDNLFHVLGASFNHRIRGIALAMSLERALLQARLSWNPGEFLILGGLSGLAFGFLGGTLFHHLLFALLFFSLGFVLPFLWLGKRCQQRQRFLEMQLPDAIMLIANALRAGNSFLQALQMVEDHIPEPLAGEFHTALQEIKWGIPIETALLNLRGRIASTDIELLTEAILIQRETGGNLSEILLNIHDTIRDRHRLRGEINAYTAQGKLSGLILALMPAIVGALFSVINPSYIRSLFVDPRGQAMLVVATILEAIGCLMIRKITELDF